MPQSPMQLTIDTREQRAWHFQPGIVETKRGTLNFGDYALQGDAAFAIERKSMDDFVGTVASGWDRFLRELDRMADADTPARIIIVEGTLDRCINKDHQHYRCEAGFVLKRVAQLSLMGVSVLFAENPTYAAMLAYSIFKERRDAI